MENKNSKENQSNAGRFVFLGNKMYYRLILCMALSQEWISGIEQKFQKHTETYIKEFSI